MPQPPARPCADALAALDEVVRDLEGVVPAVRAARPPAADDLARLVGRVGPACEAVRQAVAAVAAELSEPPPGWADRGELEAHLDRLGGRLRERAEGWRERLRGVAAELAGGRVVKPRTGKPHPDLEPHRVRAAEATAAAAEADVPVRLPGPEAGPWLGWAWEQPADELAVALTGPVAGLLDFVEAVEPGQWRPAEPVVVAVGPPVEPPPPAAEVRPPEPGPQPEPEPEPIPEVAPVAVVPPPVPPPPAPVAVVPPPEPVVAVPPPVPVVAPQPDPVPVATPAPPRSAVPSVALPEPGEVLERARAGEYLPAALLAYAREVAGAATDPPAVALLVAHHVAGGSAAGPWPDWCRDAAAAGAAVAAHPEGARLVYLAAQCQATAAGRIDPLAGDAADVLLGAFNDTPAVRQWLAALAEVRGAPGLLDAVLAGDAAPDPRAAYRAARRAFLDHTALGGRRLDRGAYHHRQDLYLTRKPEVQELLRLIKGETPHPDAAGEHPAIEAFLNRTADRVVSEWVRANGGVVFNGRQREAQEQAAGEYLAVAGAAWRAARTAVVPPRRDEAAAARRKLDGLLPAARTRAAGRAWRPLFDRLTGGPPT